MNTIDRRKFLAGSGALASLGFLASCGIGGSGSSGGGENGGGTVRYAFWGNDERRDYYEEAFQQMGGDYPEDLRVNIEFAAYGAFQERMTTQMAARNVPDVFWVPAPQVLTYHANGLYSPISEVPTLDLSDYSAQDIEDFSLDGEHNTMPFGISVPVVRYNSTFAEEDGVEIPEDWTWEWLAEFARDYTKDNPHGRRALPFGAHFDLPFEGWLRQHGEQLWTEDGQVGFTVDGLASYIDWWKKLLDAGATTTISEQDGVQVSWTDVGDQCLLWFGNSNHIVSEALMYPDYEFKLKNIPVLEDAAAGHPFLYTPRMAVYNEISDEQKELAGHVLQYCTSDTDMIRTVGLTMGVPPNPRVAEEYEEYATAEEQEMLAVVGHDREAERKPRFEAPPGTSGWRDIMERILEDVTINDADVVSASESMIEQIENDIARGES